MTTTIYQRVHTEINIKKSRFISYLIPVTSEQDAKQQLNLLKNKHHKLHTIVLPTLLVILPG